MPLIAALVEARSSLANPEQWLLRAFNAHATTAGLDVTQETALESSAVLDGIRLISQDVARVPFRVLRRVEPRGSELARDHPVARVLGDPNPELIPMQFREMVTSFAVSAGAGYAEIIFSQGGDPLELWPIPPHRVRAMRTPAGVLVWEVTLRDGGQRLIPLENMLVVPGFTRDGVVGVDILDKMREAIGLTMATERFGSSFFGNGSNPGGAIEVPAVLSDKAYERLRKSWEDRHRGIQNAHRVALLEEGSKWVTMGVPPEAAQFLETRKFQVTETARALNLPPHKLKDLERATFTNIEEQSIDYFRGSLGPWFTRWEQAVAKRLLLPRDRDTYYLKHVIEGLLRGDIKTRYEAYAQGRQNGWLSINDVRDREDMNPIAEGGDDYHVQVNLTRVQDLGAVVAESVPDVEPTPPDAARSRDHHPEALTPAQDWSLRARQRQRTAYEALFVETARRAVRREVGGVRKAIRSNGAAFDAAAFLTDLDGFYEGHGPWLRSAFGPTLATFAQLVAGEVEGEVGSPASVTSADFAERFADRLTAASLEEIRNVVRVVPLEEAEAALGALLDQWEESRAVALTSREATRAASAFAHLAYASAGVHAVRVVTTDCPVCHGEGRVVPIEHQHPPFRDGCICQIVAA